MLHIRTEPLDGAVLREKQVAGIQVRSVVINSSLNGGGGVLHARGGVQSQQQVYVSHSLE